MRVLLLEDDDAARDVFRECLSDAGHQVVACDTIASALTVLRTSKVDLLIIDLMIGDTNSLGLAQYAGYAAPDAEVILVTGTSKFAHGEVLAEFPGVTWILRKPVYLRDLEALVSYAEQRAA
ncbi:response regulator [uncultured Roseobacter sp.]|uniref:response regulator n=1 Tax=uncultured Roseobacter sp. TaxID=114847 RepID=UPI0026258E02|nr:response regulator [uncultured Roseobacter sp.]